MNQQIVGCTKCDRLVTHCTSIAETKRKSFMSWDYWGKPVPNLGDPEAPILMVGLAPAAHGANRTGRMFTGDRSGDFLFEAMHAVGLCNQPESIHSDDGLQLTHCAITAVCHCAPPENKPTSDEQANCRPWLEQTINLSERSVILALGQLAWNAFCQVASEWDWIKDRRTKFGHGVTLKMETGATLVGCYHPSQQNTFTGKLTQAMLKRVLRKAMRLAGIKS